MRRLFFYFFMLIAITLSAESFMIDGVKYTLSDDKTYVYVEDVPLDTVDESGNKTKLNTDTIYIYSEINVEDKTYPVKDIASCAFDDLNIKNCKVILIETFIYDENVNIRRELMHPSDPTKYDFLDWFFRREAHEGEDNEDEDDGQYVYKSSNFRPIVFIVDLCFDNSLTELSDYALSSKIIENNYYDNNDKFISHLLIREIILPSNLTKIGKSAFSHLYCLTDLILPNSLTEIGEDAFSYFHMPIPNTSVKIPNSVRKIGDHAFSNSQLTSVTIPESVTEIGDGAFAFTRELRDVTIMNPNTKIDYGAFFNSGYELEFKRGEYQKYQAEKEKQRVDELAALKKRIGVSVYNNLSKGIITKGMKLSAIEDYASNEPKPNGHYSILMEMKKRINDEKKYHVVFFYNSTPMRGYTIWTKNNIVTKVIQD